MINETTDNSHKKPEFTRVLVIEKGQCYGTKLDIKANAGFAQYFIAYMLVTITKLFTIDL